jgi:hypothetical protein
MKPMKTPHIEGLHSEEEEADILGESLQTRRRNRRRGIGPKPIRHGRRYLYFDDHSKYIAEQQAQVDRNERKRARQHGASAAGARP